MQVVITTSSNRACSFCSHTGIPLLARRRTTPISVFTRLGVKTKTPIRRTLLTRCVRANHTEIERESMEITTRELWTLVHGMGFGALYLLACSGALVGLWRMTRPAHPDESESNRWL